MVVAAALVVGCGGAPERPTRTRQTGDALVQASGDEAAMAKLLRGPVVSGGLWFLDPECVRKFPAPGTIKQDHLGAFAKCLAGLHWQKSERLDSFVDVAVLTYAPGIEIEARIVEDRHGPRISWIGYAARHDLRDALPTIAPQALEALRTKGDPNGPVDPVTLAEGDAAYAWVKLCIDADGNVTSAHPREATSMEAARAFGAAAQTWQFKPFVVGSRAIPACAMLRMAARTTPKPPREVLPLPSQDETVVIAPNVLEARRVSGEKYIIPDDRTKLDIQLSGVSRVVGAFKLCLDDTGHVEHVTMLRSTGFAAYDDTIVHTISRTWIYLPFMDEGRAAPVCTAVTFIYSQH